MEGNYANKALYTESVQPLFDKLEEKLVFLPNEAARKHFLDLLIFMLSI